MPARGEFDYVVLVFALFVVPRVLQRFRLPTAITSLGLGAAAGMGLDLFAHDQTIKLLSTFGIVSLFLFAGLDVDFAELRREARVLAQHVAIGVLVLLAVTVAAARAFDLPARAAALVALALLTPSAGFILDSLASLGVDARERFWVKSKAVASELVALATLFLTLQSESPLQLAGSTAALAAMIFVLPVLFRVFAARVVPFAPRSEFAFLIMVALLCAVATRQLGVYYLVGAFVVGAAAQRFRARVPALASDEMLHAVEVFASFFVPFYFFRAGLGLRPEHFGAEALLAGLGFLAVMVPLRVWVVALHRRAALREPLRGGVRIGVSMLPTLVFTLVIAQILHERFAAPAWLFGGLVVYTLIDTVIPGFALRVPPPVLDTPHALDMDLEAPAEAAAQPSSESLPASDSSLPAQR